MGLKERRALKVSPKVEHKQEEKKEVKKATQQTPKKIQKVETKKEPVKISITEEKEQQKVEQTQALPNVKTKTDWDKVGILGNNPVIATFKGLCKMQNKKVGQELHNLMKEWNEKNK